MALLSLEWREGNRSADTGVPDRYYSCDKRDNTCAGPREGKTYQGKPCLSSPDHSTTRFSPGAIFWKANQSGTVNVGRLKRRRWPRWSVGLVDCDAQAYSTR